MYNFYQLSHNSIINKQSEKFEKRSIKLFSKYKLKTKENEQNKLKKTLKVLKIRRWAFFIFIANLNEKIMTKMKEIDIFSFLWHSL